MASRQHMETLHGQVAVISGGLGDIGSAVARELARRGADIGVGDVLDVDAAEPLLAEIRLAGRRARYDRADVTDAEAVTHWVQAVEADLGLPTLIIPNAAIVTLKGFRTITPAEWERELRTNLNGAFHLARAGVLRLLDHKQPGRVVFIGSWAAHAPHPHIPAYCAAKAGLRMLLRCMAADLAGDGILVNEVAPGYVNAGLTADVFRQEPERRAQSVSRVPVRKMIEPEEVALQVAHLCDPANQHMTGSTLLMDGGLSLLAG